MTNNNKKLLWINDKKKEKKKLTKDEAEKLVGDIIQILGENECIRDTAFSLAKLLAIEFSDLSLDKFAYAIVVATNKIMKSVRFKAFEEYEKLQKVQKEKK
ncbi:MAG: hypothetical protein QXJ14_02570 [Candidatus Aenigmatarchaeota archaeon]